MLEEAERRVDHLVEGGFVQPTRGGLLFVGTLGIVPSGDLGFDLRNVRPSEVVAVGANVIGRRVGIYRAWRPVEVRVPARCRARRCCSGPSSETTAPSDAPSPCRDTGSR